MPGPNIVNRAQQAKRAEAAQLTTYYLTDPHATEIMGMPVTDEMRANGLVLNASQSLTLVAAGAVTTDKAAADAAAADMKARADALAEQKRTAAEAATAANDAAAAANLHNVGGQPMDQGAIDQANEKIAAGTKAPEEVDQLLATKPDNSAPASAEGQPAPFEQHAS